MGNMFHKHPVPRGQEGRGSLIVAAILLSLLLFSSIWVGTYLDPAQPKLVTPGSPSLVSQSLSSNTFNLTAISPGYEYQVSWKLGTVYIERGGEMDVYVSNQGRNRIFIYSFGFKSDWPGSENIRDVQVFVEPGETKNIGLVSFSGPQTSGRIQYRPYNVIIGAYVRNDAYLQDNGVEEWYDIGLTHHGNRFLLVDPLSQRIPTFPVRIRNELWLKTEGLITPDYPGVQEIVQHLRERYGEGYNVFHAVAAFDYVLKNIEYKMEPPGEDYWQSPAETLAWGNGDCEDHALLLASIIKSLGGSARLNIITGHAFTSIYMGATKEEAQRAWDLVEEYYGTSLTPSWIVGDGYWISADTLGGLYIGCLPVNAAPTNSHQGWTFTSTVILSSIDV